MLTGAAMIDEPEARDAKYATGMCLLAAVGVLVGLLLPMADYAATPYERVAQNTLMQHGGWWWLFPALGIVLATLRSKTIGDRIVIFVLGLLVALMAGHFFVDKSLLKLYPIGFDGSLDRSISFTGGPGIGVWVCCLSGALACVGAFVMPTPPKVPESGERDADGAARSTRDDELLAAWEGVEINPDELDPITRRALKRAGRI